jgi:hypothetical protein
MTLSRTTNHERFPSKGCVPLTRAEHTRHPGLVVCHAPLHWGAAPPLTAASGCSCGPARRTRCMLGARALVPSPSCTAQVSLPAAAACCGAASQRRCERTGCAPALATAGHRTPRPRAFRPIAPRGTGAQHPHDAVEEASMSQSGSTRERFLRWKQRLEPFPLRVGEFFAFHTGACPPPARVCQHALVLAAQCHVLVAGS